MSISDRYALAASPETLQAKTMHRFALALPLVLLACSSDPAKTTDASAPVDAPIDAPVAYDTMCVKSPSPAPFPSGACNSPKPQAPDAVDEALAKLGLDRCSFMLDTNNMPYAVMDVKDKRQLPDFTPLLASPLRLPAYGAETARWLDTAVQGKRPISSAVAAMSVRRGAPIASCMPSSWFALQTADQAPLASVLEELATLYATDFDREGTRAAVADVPLELQRALVPILRALDATAVAVDAARQPALPQISKVKLAVSWVMGSIALINKQEILDAFDAVDVKGITEASVHLANAIEAADLSRFRDADIPALDLDTPMGKVVLRGAGPDKYMPGDASEKAIFLLDTGGNDDYRVPVAAATPERSVSVAVDLGGDDRYGYVEKKIPEDNVGHRAPSDGASRNGGRTASRVGRQGSALLGVGLLWDLGKGNDTYRSLAFSQGAAVFGVGVLFDDGGIDDYTAEVLSQGASAWGIGLLLDGGGKDKYVSYASSQGYGFTQGVGALEDLDGDDSYLTDPGHPDVGGDPIYPNGQLPGKANTAMSQGCGRGNRPDAPDPGFQMSGGMGLLRDGAGNDRYVTSVFGQGCSFGLGIGMLLDDSGDDTYEGLWYVQGANAHTAVSYFRDGAGNDQYNLTFPIAATSIGVGHDYGSAVHLDEGGDDVYKAPGLSLGSGNANGLGLMVVSGGSDSFTTPGMTLGAANSTEIFGTPRRTLPTLGVFVKANGAGTYTVGGQPKPSYQNGEWSTAPNNNPDAGLTYERSIGIDRPNGKATLP